MWNLFKNTRVLPQNSSVCIINFEQFHLLQKRPLCKSCSGNVLKICRERSLRDCNICKAAFNSTQIAPHHGSYTITMLQISSKAIFQNIYNGLLLSFMYLSLYAYVCILILIILSLLFTLDTFLDPWKTATIH